MNILKFKPVTMTSLEMVDFINIQRKDGSPILAHSDFLKKVPLVLGEEGVGLFSYTYTHPQNGQKYPAFFFPKREACLMAMSYSYDLQAKVFDRMTELEAHHSLPNFNDPAAAAIAWAEQYRATQTAIATKAEIGCRREYAVSLAIIALLFGLLVNL
jgi:hypothetical protein